MISRSINVTFYMNDYFDMNASHRKSEKKNSKSKCFLKIDI